MYKKICLFVCMFLLLPICVLAKDKMELNVDKTDITVGDEIIVTAKVSEELKSYAVIATLKYDENVFQKIEETNFDLEDADSITYNEYNNKFGIINRSGSITEDGVLFSVRLKVKKDANVGDTNIALTNISSSNGNGKISIPSCKIKVLITRDATPGETIPENEENTITEDTENTITTFTTMPIIYILGSIALVSLVLVLIFIRKNKLSKKMIITYILLEIALFGTIVALIISNNSKKDVNNDGTKDYNDAEEIIKYLIDIKGNKEDNQDEDNNEENITNDKNTTNKNKNKKPHTNNEKPKEDLDTNNDGEVDIGDVGDIVEEVTKNTKVELFEEKYDNIYYVEKGEITLKFKADITPADVLITKVKIDNQYYDVNLNENVYSVQVNRTIAGKYDFVITEVVLNNGKNVKTKLKLTREILKDVPYVNKFNLDDASKSLSFHLVDDDNAFISGMATIYAGNEIIISKEISNFTEINDMPLEEDKTYFVEIVGNYELDSNRNDQNNAYVDEVMFEHEFMLGGDYNFELTNFGITDALQPGEKPIISFTSSNTRNAKIMNATLTNDNKEASNYQISKIDGNNYEIVVDDADITPGKHTISLDDVGLDSLKTFENNKDYVTNTLTYTVLKEAPKTEDIKLTSNLEEKAIDIEFMLKDPNFAINSLNIVVENSTGKVISKEELIIDQFITNLLENKPIKTTVSYGNDTDGLYTVKILANYDLSEKYNYTNQNIGEMEILTHGDTIYISDMFITNDRNERTNNLYPTKNAGNYQLAITLVTNGIRAYTAIGSVTINGLNYPAQTIEGYKTKVYVNIPDEAGVLTLKANRVLLIINNYNLKLNDYYSVPEKTIKVDVLKDAPKIENLSVEENYEQDEVTFDFDVVLDEKASTSDEDFKDGKIILNGETQPINRGKNSVTFKNVEKDTIFDLDFTASYDLDSDNPEINAITGDQNEKIDNKIFSVKYGLFNKNTYDSIAITDGEILSQKKNKYFEKNERMYYSFDIIGIDEEKELTPFKIVVNDKEYLLTKTFKGYAILLDGFTSFGEKSITITDIIFKNGLKVKLTNPYTVKIEVLKDKISINDYNYKIDSDNIKITFNKKDTDKSLIDNLMVRITDDFGKVIYNDSFKNEITFVKANDVIRYKVEVIGSYDRDTEMTINSENNYQDAVLLSEIISLDVNNIELKDIEDVNLYLRTTVDGIDQTDKIDEISIVELENNLDNYFVEIIMTNLPTVRSKIASVKNIDNHLFLELDCNYITTEKGNANQTIKIDFGEISANGKALNEEHPDIAFEKLIEKLQRNENVELTKNYDAATVSISDDYFVDEYNGTLNGNGYTIKNLDRPLFNKINNGTIENLKLENVTMPRTKGNGAIALTTNKSIIRNVLISNYTKINNEAAVGTFVGTATDSTFENCKVSNFKINSNSYTQQSIGGLVGYSYGSTFENCYASGSMSDGWNFRAGLVGNVARASTFINNYTQVSFNNPWGGDIICGIACGSGGGTYKNNISVGSGIRTRIYGSANESDNNYYLASDNDDTKDQNGVIKITTSEVNTELFRDKAHFDPTIWSLNDISMESLPKLIPEVKTKLESETSYEKDKELLYSNLMKLMPFYDNEKIINVGKNIDVNNLLNKKEIQHILPISQDGSLVTYLTYNNVKKLDKIKIVFSDNSKTEYAVIFDKVYDMVASYRITDLNIDYSYNHYLIDTNSQIINDLTNYLRNLNYADNLDILTSKADSRIYSEFYNDVTSKELQEFVLKYLANSNYINTTNDEAINDYLEGKIKRNQKLEKALYVYNYFRRFYDLDVNGMKIYDFVMFNMQGFDKNLTASKITDLFLSDATGANFDTNQTNNRYVSVLGGYTKLNSIPKFLEFIVTKFSDYDMAEWTRTQFKGILKEITIEGHSEIQYTLWDHLSSRDSKYGEVSFNYVLPILTLPETAAYIISAPVQYIIGAQRTYMNNPYSETDLANFEEKITSYTDRMQNYYTTAYSILEDANLFNNIHIYHLDKRYTRTLDGSSIFNYPYTTEEPFHKNFNEVTGAWAASAGVNAGASGSWVQWQVAGVLDSTLTTDGSLDVGHVTFKTFTHESAHNIDARLFLMDNGRRYDAGGEDYADSFLMQSFEKFGIVMNLSINFDLDKLNEKEQAVGSNLTPERINSEAKIKDFYNKAFQTIYIMDYLEAKAFLQLDDEAQKELGIQVSYPNENAQFAYNIVKDAEGNDVREYYGPTYIEDEYARFRAYQTSRFTQLSEIENFDYDKLQTIDDLVDNKIMLYPSIYKVSSRADNSYGGEGYNTVHWYQPHNDYGRPDSYALKWISYEMLGYAGYKKGFVEYASNIYYEIRKTYDKLATPFNEDGTPNLANASYKSDAMALETITEGKYTDFDKYKKDRFKEVETNLSRLNKVINAKEYVQEFYDALKKDSIEMKEEVAKVINRYGSEANALNNYWGIRELWAARSYPNSSEVRYKIYSTLKNLTNDFTTDEIYMDTWQQDANDLSVTNK